MPNPVVSKTVIETKANWKPYRISIDRGFANVLNLAVLREIVRDTEELAGEVIVHVGSDGYNVQNDIFIDHRTVIPE